jgi:hypothetical protein
MALLGTHIRFALDNKESLNIKRLDKYLSGTIYPDSRYLSKIDRKTTHNKKFLNKIFYKSDDFKKGWFIHLIYDQIQFKVLNDIFPDLLDKFKQEKKNLSLEHWILRSNLKILQDINDISKFSIKKYLKYLEYIETPNGEKDETIKKYNQIFIDIYKKNNPTFQDLINMWIKLGVDKKTTDQMEKQLKQINSDKTILERIPLIYPKTLDYYKKLKK